MGSENKRASVPVAVLVMILFICYAIAYKLGYVIYHSSNFTGLVDQLVTLHTLLQFRLLVNFSYLCVHTCVCEGGGGGILLGFKHHFIAQHRHKVEYSL